jgi:peroxiredoxin
MRVYHVTIPLSILFAGAGFYLAAASRPAPPLPPPNPVHPVTDPMRVAAERMKLKAAPEFNLVGLDGKKHSLKEYEDKPTFLYFIKYGCPCSIEAEPVIQALGKFHGDKINFVGITEATPDKAKKWASDNQADHIILCDPTLATMKAYEAPNGVYTAIIAPDGRIEKQWPGWSQSILLEENAMLAKLTGQSERPFDTQYAPMKDTSGCPYFERTP